VTYDVVVIGGGHNGLVAANYLADAGFAVAVLEGASTLGGLSSSGPMTNAPDHIANYGATDFAFWALSPVEAELGLRDMGLRAVPVDPQFAYLHPDGQSLAFWHDASRTADEIRYYSRKDAETWRDYVRILDRLVGIMHPLMLMNLARPDRDGLRTLLETAGRAHPIGEILRWAGSSGEDYVESRFSHPVVKQALFALAASFNPIQARGTTFAHLSLGILHRAASRRPVGGMQSLIDVLAERLRLHGGVVQTGVRVTEILVEAGRARGVRMADGHVVRAHRAVVATCDPRQLFEHLLPSGALPARLQRRAAKIPANVTGAGPMSLNIALNGQVTLNRHQKLRRDDLDLRIPYGVLGTHDATNRAYRDSMDGRLPAAEDMLLCVSVINAADPGQSPAGKDVIYVFSPCAPVRVEGGWLAAERDVGDRIIKRTADAYEGIAELEIDRHAETPAVIANRAGATNGCIFHVDLLPGRSGPLRPALGLGNFRLPVKGLFLGGSGAHPTGAVTGLPGRLAAREILRTNRRVR
jgi:phytoene dehydrogenase-like protein